MNKRIKRMGLTIFLVFMLISNFLIVLCSCDRLTNKICGEPTGEIKELMDSINNANKDILFGRPVPCYPVYYEIKLNVDVDTAVTKEIEKILRKNNFREILIYNKEEQLIKGDMMSM